MVISRPSLIRQGRRAFYLRTKGSHWLATKVAIPLGAEAGFPSPALEKVSRTHARGRRCHIASHHGLEHRRVAFAACRCADPQAYRKASWREATAVMTARRIQRRFNHQWIAPHAALWLL